MFKTCFRKISAYRNKSESGDREPQIDIDAHGGTSHCHIHLLFLLTTMCFCWDFSSEEERRENTRGICNHTEL